MLSRRIGLFVAGMVVAAPLTGIAAMAPASAKPAVDSSARAVAPMAKVKRSGITCNGQSFNPGNVVFGLGPRMGFTFGSRDGKVRMVKVFTNNGSNATFSLGAISWSGAVVESSSFGPNYCITFPGSSTGVVVKGKQGGESWATTFRW